MTLRLKPVYCALGSLSCWSAASKQWQPDNNGRTGAAHKQAIEWRILSNHQKCVRAYDFQSYPQWSQELCTDLVYFVSSNWYHGLWDFEQEKRPMMKMCAWNICMWLCISWEAIFCIRYLSLWKLTGSRVAFLGKVIDEYSKLFDGWRFQLSAGLQGPAQMYQLCTLFWFIHSLTHLDKPELNLTALW